MVVEKAPIFINSSLRCGSQDGIAHVHYVGVVLLNIAVDRFSLYDLLCWSLEEHESRRWWLAPFLGGGSHHETAQSVFDVHQCFLVSCTRCFWLFLLIRFFKPLYIFFEPGLSWAVIVPRIMTFFSTVIASDVIHISPGSLILIFSVAFIVPSFPALHKNDLVSDPV